MITRRNLLQCILAAGFAPAIGHAGIMMPVRKIVPPKFLLFAHTSAPIQHSGVDLRAILAESQEVGWDRLALMRDLIMYGIAVGEGDQVRGLVRIQPQQLWRA